MTYYHCTNLKKPYDAVDAAFLAALGDYQEGDPVPAQSDPTIRFIAKTFDELVAAGIVGIYTTFDALNTTAVKRLTGWTNPMRVLGQAL